MRSAQTASSIDAIMLLQVGSLYIILFARATPHDYHWALYHHIHPTKGTKWHIRNISDRWFSTTATP